ncbi:PDR/VanB family oxidoreductase [Streptomyces sp. HNM0574]|uniref:PDR/VanB family oxidoreductase n=1 Tax=Streptomyces sp. HNM0574 TaxID=2714954 RepID=UPI00146A9AAF|nr:PDR/VanB family oxidoreductase [Streptomyces sp. HNM0574]NLU67910.1 oxidoreductase [Streptomyces sp. HNM0574]
MSSSPLPHDGPPPAVPAPLGPVQTTPPPDLYGRGRSDRFMRFLDAVVGLYIPVANRGDRYGRRGQRETGGPRELVVADREFTAEDVLSLRLVSADGAPLPPWGPGAHLDLTLPSGRKRQYSLCGRPEDRYAYRIAVRRIEGGGGGSVEVHERLTAGAKVTVRGPRNAFPFAEDRSVLLLAGGIGITPLLPMARAAARLGLDWRLVHTGRSRATMPFAAELEKLDAGSGRVEIRPDDEYGVPDGARLLAGVSEGTAVYCCGPEPMLASVTAAFGASAATALHFERFAAAPVQGGRPFELELRRSGEVLPVGADESALDVLLRRDPATAYSCRQGFCGVCTVRVCSGEVEHRESRAGEAERADGRMRVCVSRAPEGTRLELDL